MFNYKRMYETGVSLVKSGNLVDAISYFNTSKEDKEYRLDSLNQLFSIFSKAINYSKCRELIEEMRELTDTTLMEAHLDNFELNCQSSLEKYMELFNKSQDQKKILFYIADLYVFFGFNDVARSMYETLLLNGYDIKAKEKIITLDLLENDYIHAIKLLESIQFQIDEKSFNQKITIINYFLDEKLDKIGGYLNKLLTDYSDETLTKHIDRHKFKRNKSTTCFHEDTNTLELLTKVREKLKHINCRYYMGNITSRYLFSLENSQEYSGGMSVETIIGTDEIITMYPIQLSSEFNREGLLESEELLLRRRGVR